MDNREIKFRAWNPRIKQMEFDFEIVFFRGETDLRFTYYDDADYLIHMQYTGLKDKYDKEIYEGDILRWFPDKRKKYQDEIIRWSEKGAQFHFGNWYENDFPDTTEESKIVGNIYENPNLLKRNNIK